MSEKSASSEFVMETLVLVSLDMAGFARWAVRKEAIEVAQLFQSYYARVGEIVRDHGGRVVKFMGDGCFAVFPEQRCVDAIDAALEALRFDTGHPALRMGGGLHLAPVATGELGTGDDRRWDVVGAGVNHLFRLGGGAGLRLSEPVYRRLPSERRGPFRKESPPATYHYEGE